MYDRVVNTFNENEMEVEMEECESVDGHDSMEIHIQNENYPVWHTCKRLEPSSDVAKQGKETTSLNDRKMKTHEQEQQKKFSDFIDVSLCVIAIS